MKVLVLTLNAWNSTNSTGNTISNLFSGMSENDEVANLYCRDESIDNSICERYFRITERDILLNLFTPWRCGEFVKKNTNKTTISNKTMERSKAVVTFGRKYTILLLLRELLWTIPVWKNNRLNKYLKDFAPDFIYMHGHYNLYMHKILSYCAKVTNAKIVLFWGDDMYGRKSYKPLDFFYQSLLRKRFTKSIKSAKLLFGGSIKLCEEYSDIFRKPFVPFFKECKYLCYDPDKKVGNPISIVYAGNLLFGREKMIIELVKSLSRINKKHLSYHYSLSIYSNSSPSKELFHQLNNSSGCVFMGCKPYSEICKAMDKSDLALFIESFDKRSILSTRLSFSTKIIDCMQSTAGILAIGPKEIASIDYILKNGLGYTITSIDDIETKMAYLAEHSGVINLMNKKKVDFAKKYHTNTSAKALAEIRRLK